MSLVTLPSYAPRRVPVNANEPTAELFAASADFSDPGEERTTMKKLALAAGALLAATALTSAAVVPAAGEDRAHTKRFVAKPIADHGLSAHTFAAAEVDRHAGHVIGYDSTTGHFYATGRVRIWYSFALKNGTITAVVHYDATSGLYPGRILHGTGKYKGIDGTITARPVHDPEKTYITLTYHF
jgi:hypothetical protein